MIFLTMPPAAVEQMQLEPLTATESVLEAAVLASLAIDWAQTRDIVRWQRSTIPNDYHEKNVVLGQFPTKAAVDRYFALAAITHHAILRLLPHRWRTRMLVATLAVQLWAVGNNHRIGLRVQF